MTDGDNQDDPQPDTPESNPDAEANAEAAPESEGQPSPEADAMPTPGAPQRPIASMESPGQVGKYVLEEHLGEGGMGTVWKSMHPDFGLPVAIKTVQGHSPAFAKRFLQEARSAALISHPRVARTFDAGTDNGVQYIVMEYLSGGTLADRLKNGPIEVPEALDIVAGVAEGLAAASDVNVIHRDIKPENIMLDDKGLPKLVDLGLAKEAGMDSKLTVDGTLLGTPTYIAPEQAKGEAVDTRADIYSLGATLFHLVMGDTPCHANNAVAMSLKHCRGPTPNPKDRNSSLPEPLCQLVIHMMAMQPPDRPQTPDDLLAEIRKTQHKLQFKPRRSTPGGHIPVVAEAEPAKSNNASLIINFVVLALVATVWFISRSVQENDSDGGTGGAPVKPAVVATAPTGGTTETPEPGTDKAEPDLQATGSSPGETEGTGINTGIPAVNPNVPEAKDPQPPKDTDPPPVKADPPPTAGGDKTYMIINLSGGSDAASYPVNYSTGPPEDLSTDKQWRTSHLVLRLVPAGTFKMGSPADETGREQRGHLETAHNVTLSKGFYVGVFEITQRQWEHVMNSAPAEFVGSDRPVEQVSYEDIRGRDVGAVWPAGDAVDDESFMGSLRKRTQLSFDLPTEAQWEYACRAGTQTAYGFGGGAGDLHKHGNYRDTSSGLAVGDNWYEKADAANADGAEATNTVGSYAPNKWGLYDMHGNVWEWCLDWHSIDLGSAAFTDPKGGESGSIRVIRGGGFRSVAASCRSSERRRQGPMFRYSNVGLRVVMTRQQRSTGGYATSAMHKLKRISRLSRLTSPVQHSGRMLI